MGKLEPNSVIFLGVADHVRDHVQRLSTDIYQLAVHKGHFVFPAITATSHWVFAVKNELATSDALAGTEIRMLNEADDLLGNVRFAGHDNLGPISSEAPKTTYTPIASSSDGDGRQHTALNIIAPSTPLTRWVVLHFMMPFTVNVPGKVRVVLDADGGTSELGVVEFQYIPAPPLNPETILALRSDPQSIKIFRMQVTCGGCSSVLNVYTSLERVPSLDSENHIWQYDLGDVYTCNCGRTSFPLKYLKESLHGLLLSGSMQLANLAYERRYAHSQVLAKVDDFDKLLRVAADEAAVQTFLEENPIMLAQLRAKRIYIKPKILGRYVADFAVLDAQNQLILIELESPKLKLFKKDGHKSAALMHAYEQVVDWLDQYHRHAGAVLEQLEIESADVMAVKGLVIAGRSTSASSTALRRHLSEPPYPNIGFCTLDDLANSVKELSKNLA